jgi:lysyl-tRNA synthetase, class II
LSISCAELNDPDDQRARFEAQARAEAAGDEEAQRMDDRRLIREHHHPINGATPIKS